MNILVLGNGFDIAHNLNTQYQDFLNAVGHTYYLLSLEKPERDNKWKDCKECEYCNLPNALICNLDVWVQDKKKDTIKEFHKYWNNFWFQYFHIKPAGTWIDFEKDIKYVCMKIEKALYNRGEIKNINDVVDLDTEFAGFSSYIKNKEVRTYKQLIDLLYKDLYDLVNSFDIYISHFINKEECAGISRDIVALSIDKVISFNYSNTYRRLYGYYKDLEYDYIHGKAGGQYINKVFSNLVLGYDENENSINEKLVTIFVPFKKYYQRVLMETGNQYAKWVKEMQNDLAKEENQNNPQIIHNVYFFGHSMDITDKDIIKALIINKNVNTTIYYHSSDVKMKIVKNLIHVLEYSNFLEYTQSGNIKFVFQDRNLLQIKYSERYQCLIAVKSLYTLPYISTEDYINLNNWFENISGNNFKEELKYFYLAIDALQKWDVMPERIETLVKLCESNKGTPCSYTEFLKEYALFCGADGKFENAKLRKIIETNYNKRIDSKKEKYEKFLRNIGIDGKTSQHYKPVEGYLNLTYMQLNRVKILFLQYFDIFEANKCIRDNEKPLSHSEIFEGMVELLLLIKENLVEKLFSSAFENENEPNINRMHILLKQYNSAWKAKEAIKNGKLNSTGLHQQKQSTKSRRNRPRRNGPWPATLRYKMLEL